jgi:hypothetical protein
LTPITTIGDMSREGSSSHRDPDQDWKSAVETLWDAVAALRDEHASGRRREGIAAATTKEIAEAIGVSDRTLGDWLRKRSVVPDWYGLRKLVEYLGGDAEEWLPRWQQAKAAYDSRPRARTTPVGPDKPPAPVVVSAPAASPGGSRARRIVVFVLAVTVLLAVAAAVAARTWPRGAHSNRPSVWQTTIRNTWSTAKGKDVGVVTSSNPALPQRDGPAYFLGSSVQVVCQDRHGYPVTDRSQGRTSPVWDKLDTGFWISDLYTDLPKNPPPPGLPACG